MPEHGLVGEAKGAYDRAYARRLALGRILRPRAEAIQEATLGQAYRATNFLGMGAVAIRRWEAISRRPMPACLAALEAGDIERFAFLDEARVHIKALNIASLQRFAIKPLVSLSFRLAMREVRMNAKAEGFEPEELADELRVFQRAFDARILYRG